MGCGTCSTTKDNGIPSGCKSNGTCGTSGCNKLNVYNWLSDMELPAGQKAFDIVEVRFKGSRKEFFRNVNDVALQVGDMVAVEGSPGHDIGEISMMGELVRFQMKKKGISEGAADVKMLYRLARPVDLDKYNEVKAKEFTTMHRSRTIALHLNLKMKLSDVEFQGDGKKATFYYTADDRVDFRELIKRLADEFKIRVEMRQIGMRQEASRLGGIGSCGRELCCSTWLTDFKIVSTSAARYQNLSLNPLKLAGQCGKLKCCLNYELDSYMDAIKDIPDSSVKLLTEKGIGSHRKTDIFKRLMWFAFEEEKSEARVGWGSADSWIPLSVDRVKEIIALNKQNIKAGDVGHVILPHKKEPLFDFKDVVGQDSLTRMDNRKKKKKKKENPVTPLRVKVLNNVPMLRKSQSSKKYFSSFFFVLLTIVLSSCDSTRVFEENKKIEKAQWRQDEPLVFLVNISDTVGPHNVYLNVRNAGMYPFSNIFLFINTLFPQGQIDRDTVEVTLASPEGKWLGDGLGDIYDNQALFHPNVRFPQAGEYRFEIYQAMRVNPLPGIMDAGLRIEKAKK